MAPVRLARHFVPTQENGAEPPADALIREDLPPRLWRVHGLGSAEDKTRGPASEDG